MLAAPTDHSSAPLQTWKSTEVSEHLDPVLWETEMLKYIHNVNNCYTEILHISKFNINDRDMKLTKEKYKWKSKIQLVWSCDGVMSWKMHESKVWKKCEI